MKTAPPIGKYRLNHTYDSLQTAVESAQARLPITDSNTLNTVLRDYHNTLLSQLDQEAQHERTDR